MVEQTQLLLDCLHRDRPVAAERLLNLLPVNWHALLSLAAVQRVRPLLGQRLKQKGLAEFVPADVGVLLREAARRNTLNNLHRYHELQCLLVALQSEGIPLILLKGIYLADAVYENIGTREMTDIDVLARPADLERIAAILTSLGYVASQPICIDITLATSHHLPAFIKNGHLKFEIHWSLTKPGKSYSIDPDSLWKRAVPCRVAGRDAQALAPEDQLLHLCLHTSYQHQFVFGLRPFCDIAATIAHFDNALDWQALMDRADCWGWQRGVYLALRLAKDLVGAAVPTAILDRLMPADMTEAIFAVARTQVFSDKYAATQFSASFAALLERASLLDKIRIFWQRVFLSRASIAAVYGVPLYSLKIYWCYPRRIFDVLCRHRQLLVRYHQDDDGRLHAMVTRQNQISTWLAG